MARISGVDLPREKRVEIGLTYIYGIGRVTSNRILAQANVNPDTRVRDLTDEEVARIRDVNPTVPIIATGGPTDESILATIEAGANAITYTPPTNGEIFKDMMNKYRGDGFII